MALRGRDLDEKSLRQRATACETMRETKAFRVRRAEHPAHAGVRRTQRFSRRIHSGLASLYLDPARPNVAYGANY